MSNQAVTEFLQELLHSEALREELKQAEAGQLEKAPAMMAVAGRYGFDFTTTELHSVLEALHRRCIGDLTEAELQAVAGSLIDWPCQ